MRYAPKKVSAELCDILRQACTGDALTCIRAVNDMRGLTAWPRQWRGRCVLVGAVTYPQKVKELKHVEAALVKWNEQGKVVNKEFGEQFSETIYVKCIWILRSWGVRMIRRGPCRYRW